MILLRYETMWVYMIDDMCPSLDFEILLVVSGKSTVYTACIRSITNTPIRRSEPSNRRRRLQKR